jgi:hypothetical protein
VYPHDRAIRSQLLNGSLERCSGCLRVEPYLGRITAKKDNQNCTKKYHSPPEKPRAQRDVTGSKMKHVGHGEGLRMDEKIFKLEFEPTFQN